MPIHKMEKIRLYRQPGTPDIFILDLVMLQSNFKNVSV